MTKPFDYKEVDAALERAAWKAVHGTREDKAGRFTAEPSAKDAATSEAEKKSKR